MSARSERNGPKMDKHKTEVLVVGAGPTGLMAAGEMAHRGVSCRIIEKAPERSPWSRALATHARTLEVADLAGNGLADECVRRGYTMRGLNVSADSRWPAPVELHRLDTRFPYVLALPQLEIEDILETHLGHKGISVERGAELVGFEQRDGWVESRVRLADGREELIVSRYLVGCDGAHSTVRKAVGLPFEGEPYPYVTFVADAEVEGDLPQGGIRQFYSFNRGLVFAAYFGDGYHRIVAIDYTKQDRPETEDLQLADLQESVDAIASTKLVLKEPRRIGRFRASRRQIPNYRSGRVFLAGDAAHIHAPTGGQGLNAGVQDAFNLAWKMALVLREKAPEALLDSYNEERHMADARVLRMTHRIFRSSMIKNPVLKAARELLAQALVPLPLVQRKLSETLSGICNDYHSTGWASAERFSSAHRKALEAGRRAPDVEVSSDGEPSVRLYELLRGPAYKLFVFVSMDHLSRDRDHVSRLVRAVKNAYGDTIQPYVVLDEGVHAAPESKDATVLVDLKCQFRNKFGARHGNVLLLRPDGYVALHRHGLHWGTLAPALDGWANRSPSQKRISNGRHPHGSPTGRPILNPSDGRGGSAEEAREGERQEVLANAAYEREGSK